jgi:hypothetical protein
MPIPDSRSNYKRTNLFLLRVWCDDADQNENQHGDEGEMPGLVWHGRVQQTVSGEAHSFDGKRGLLEVLEVMINKDRLLHTGPLGKISSEAALRPGSDDQTEPTSIDEQPL